MIFLDSTGETLISRSRSAIVFRLFSPILLPARNPSPMTGAGNNTYLLAGKGQASLVDAGVGQPRHLDALARALDAAGAVLTHVLITHGHADHASGAPGIASAHRSASFWKYPWPEEDANYPVTWQAVSDGDALQG